jgi:hypothetical protein
LLRLLAFLTLAKLLELCFARLGNLVIDFTTLGIRLSADTQDEGGHDDECCHFHTFSLPTVVIGYSRLMESRANAFAFTIFT